METLHLELGYFLVKGFELHKWVSMEPMVPRLHIPYLSLVSLADNKPNKWQPKNRHCGDLLKLIRSAGGGGGQSFQHTSPLLSQLQVGLPLAQAASPLILEKTAPPEGYRVPLSADTKEKTLSQKQENPTSRIH